MHGVPIILKQCKKEVTEIMDRFWSFKNISNNAEEEVIELRIDGEIIDDDYAWLYEWFGIPAASPNNFREELKQYKGKNISV
jgi:hypothetical protein